MRRLVFMIPNELWQRLSEDAEKCGCGSVSAHLRHVLKEYLDAHS